jgi:hypothetical protein
MLTKLFNQFLKDVETFEIAIDALRKIIFDYFDLEPGNHASFSGSTVLPVFLAFPPICAIFQKCYI